MIERLHWRWRHAQWIALAWLVVHCLFDVSWKWVDGTNHELYVWWVRSIATSAIASWGVGIAWIPGRAIMFRLKLNLRFWRWRLRGQVGVPWLFVSFMLFVVCCGLSAFAVELARADDWQDSPLSRYFWTVSQFMTAFAFLYMALWFWHRPIVHTRYTPVTISILIGGFAWSLLPPFESNFCRYVMGETPNTWKYWPEGKSSVCSVAMRDWVAWDELTASLFAAFAVFMYWQIWRRRI